MCRKGNKGTGGLSYSTMLDYSNDKDTFKILNCLKEKRMFTLIYLNIHHIQI